MPSDRALEVAKNYFENHDTNMGAVSIIELAQVLDEFVEPFRHAAKKVQWVGWERGYRIFIDEILPLCGN